MANKIKVYRKSVLKILKKFKKPIINVSFGLMIATVFYTVGLNIGNGRIQVGNGKFITYNSNNEPNLPKTLNYVALQQEYNILKENFDGKLTSQQLQDGIMNGLTTATGDPFTEYFNASQAKAFTDELNNTFSGIGAELSQNPKGQIQVVSPLTGFPADKAGLKSQDIITSINGKSTSGQSVDAAVNSIRGPNGSTVTLGILRGTQQITLKITRQQITSPSVNHSVINGNIGYIQITSFANDTPSLAQQAASDLKSKGVKYIILDLRNNPGGLVTAAQSVSSLWLPSGQTILVEKHGTQVVQTYQSSGNDILNGIPTAVLINGGSASASEITASALHDNHAAIIIGEKSYGKGTAQEIFPLSGGAEMKVTIVHWFTPNNVSIEYKGITPDITVKPGANDSALTTDTQKTAAINYLQSH